MSAAATSRGRITRRPSGSSAVMTRLAFPAPVIRCYEPKQPPSRTISAAGDGKETPTTCGCIAGDRRSSRPHGAGSRGCPRPARRGAGRTVDHDTVLVATAPLPTRKPARRIRRPARIDVGWTNTPMMRLPSSAGLPRCDASRCPWDAKGGSTHFRYHPRRQRPQNRRFRWRSRVKPAAHRPPLSRGV